MWHGGSGLSSAAEIESFVKEGRPRAVRRRPVRVNSVLITGTTSGLGRGLLEHYAERGVKVISGEPPPGRRARGPLPVRPFRVPGRPFGDRMSTTLVRGLAASGDLPDVFILNAGINRLDNDEAFDLPLYREVIETNLYGVLNFIGPLTALPAGRVERHVVAISSMVNYAGNPYGLGYQTSKQALTTCFDVWSRHVRGDRPGVQTGHPGTRSHLDLHDGRQAPRLDVRIRSLSSASLESTVRAISQFCARPAGRS